MKHIYLARYRDEISVLGLEGNLCLVMDKFSLISCFFTGPYHCDIKVVEPVCTLRINNQSAN